ncbi:MAG: hypothetical protein ACRBB0_20285 [Pelagimonas sp.]|uniref:hypothetical protein n=1 Tax=Pelagimonas sp. TaxID=2073170 RepID=UPI003D6A7975
MPWLPFYCYPNDISFLHTLLGDDLVFIVPGEQRSWSTSKNFVPADGSTTALWHTAAGQLHIDGKNIAEPSDTMEIAADTLIADPSHGPTSSTKPVVPYFGEDSGIFWLDLRFTGREPGSTCGVSSFGWSGDRYPYGAPRATKNRWAKLRRNIAKLAQKVPLGGLESGSPAHMWAFPNAAKNAKIADINP